MFNVIGYYAMYAGLKAKANHALKQKLDSEQYEERELLSMKIPLTLPYQTDWLSAQRVDGDFEIDGESFNLVSQKVERDTLTVYYIKDHKETDLLASLTDFVNATTDAPLSKKAGKLMENFIKDYLSTRSEMEHDNIGWASETSFGTLVEPIDSSCPETVSPPPRRLA